MSELEIRTFYFMLTGCSLEQMITKVRQRLTQIRWPSSLSRDLLNMAFNMCILTVTDKNPKILAIAPQGFWEDLGTRTDEWLQLWIMVWYAPTGPLLRPTLKTRWGQSLVFFFHRNSLSHTPIFVCGKSACVCNLYSPVQQRCGG